MAQLPKALIGKFLDTVVKDRKQATSLLAEHPELLDARWILGETLVHFLAVEGFVEGVRFLAELGANVNAVNEFGDPPLIEVAVIGNDKVAAVLLKFGANPNATSMTRNNVLDCAVASGNVHLVSMLLEAGADARYVTDIGTSVFDALPEKTEKREGILKTLAQHGITPLTSN